MKEVNTSGSTSDRVDGRSEHRAETRASLIEASLWLFATKGYEQTAVEEIAEMAGVSPRTFFRYFETKDRVLRFGGDSLNRAMVRALPDQPAHVTDLDAIAAVAVAVAPRVSPPKARLRLYFRALDASPVLLGHHAMGQADHESAVAAALAARRGMPEPDDRCRVAAQLGSVAMGLGYRVWLGSKRPLTEALEQSFVTVREVAVPPVHRAV